MASTTIQVSDKLASKLKSRKLFDRESYEEVLWDLLEDVTELNEQTKRDIEQSRAELKAGKFVTLEQVRKEMRARGSKNV